jgi:hypothetical protein
MPHYVVARAGTAPGLATSLPQQCAPIDQARIETCESLFNALDGRDVMVLGRRWRIEVFSVLELAGRRYVQLALHGPEQYMLTLRMRPGAESRQVIPTLLPWLAHPTSSGEILEVAEDDEGRERPSMGRVMSARLATEVT